ncbi:hypothetical protein GCM10027022_10910 [Alpinimonas psychrophila]
MSDSNATGVHAPKDRVTYIPTRGQDDEFYEKLTLDFIRKWGECKPQRQRQLAPGEAK